MVSMFLWVLPQDPYQPYSVLQAPSRPQIGLRAAQQSGAVVRECNTLASILLHDATVPARPSAATRAKIAGESTGDSNEI